VGYRQLHIADNVPLLLSGSQAFVWEPGHRVESSPKACNAKEDGQAHPHFNPTKGVDHCSCGIYCYKDIDYLYGTYIRHPTTTMKDFFQCIVRLYLTGRVVRAQFGYRAQYARVAEIWVLYVHEDVEFDAMMKSAELGDAYGVEGHHTLLDPQDKRWKSNATTPIPAAIARMASRPTMTVEKLEILWRNRGILKMEKADRRFIREQLYRRYYERKKRLTARVENLTTSLAEAKVNLVTATAAMDQLLRER
jgi:hypothetical protein